MVKKNEEQKPLIGASASKKSVTDKDIDKFLVSLNKKFESEDDVGIGGVVYASESLIKAIPIPTTYPEFNAATGLGGFPNNGVVEISGEEGIGKTWIALDCIAQAQKLYPEKRAVLVDLEGTSDPDRLRFAGIDLDKLVTIDPCMGEILFEKLLVMIEKEFFSVIVIDSIPALQPKSIYEGDIGDKNYGPIAALLSDALRKVAPLCRKHQTLLIMTNQTRENIGATQFQPKEVTTGGKAIRFYAHMRIQLKKLYDASRKISFDIKDATGKMVGHRVMAKFIKNRYGPPFREGMFEVLYQEPDIALEVIKQAKKAKLWNIYKGDCKYMTAEDKLIVAPDEEAFMRLLVMQGKLVEMAERLQEIQEDSGFQYLNEKFDIEKLKAIQETERMKYDFINRKSKPEKEFEPASNTE